jgi:hypothetical protein
MTPSSDVYVWSGQQSFQLNASGLKEDTLRITPTFRQTEAQFTLRLPTLCITYADMHFQNAVGGLQANYPASRAYGPDHFDPPVEILGEDEIERLTYIRGAQRVEIGPEATRIDFVSWKELVIPRLRLDLKEPAQAVLAASNLPVQIDQPLSLLVRQFADGRHIGGLTIEVRHPEYQPVEIKPQYDLAVRVIDARTLHALVEVLVEVWHWDPLEIGPFGPGVFRLDGQHWTGGDGGIYAAGRPAGELQLVTARLSGWQVTPRVFRPLAGQLARMTLRAWKMQATEQRFTWPHGLNLEEMGERCGSSGQAILELNGLAAPGALRPGLRISLPCFAGALHLDTWDTPLKIAERFRYDDPAVLAKANGLGKLAEYDGSLALHLPGWHFFHAQPFDTLQTFDQLFNLPPGSCVAVGKAFRPHPGLLYAGEVVGVPM